MSTLISISQKILEICNENMIPASRVCDSDQLQGLKLFSRNPNQLKKLFEHISSNISSDHPLEFDLTKVRGGMILTISTQALNEDDIAIMLADAGEKVEPMRLTDKINVRVAEPVKEAQYKSATDGMTRSNQSSRQRNLHTVQMTHGGEVKKKIKSKAPSFSEQLNEALEGVANSSDIQPKVVFKRFGIALKQLGKSLGIGPLQDILKKKGIKWKKSKDGQSIILYIINANTNAPQPISTINYDTLIKPHEFQERLLEMLDFARGEAPGALKTKQEQLRNQEKQAREIAKALNPEAPALPASSLAGVQAAMPK